MQILKNIGKEFEIIDYLKDPPSPEDLKNIAIKMGLLAKKCGLNGVVASPMEVSQLRRELGKDMLIVTPGVRLDTESQNDHARVHTPKNAIENGADFIVVGRPIRNAENPEEIAKRYILSIS